MASRLNPYLMFAGDARQALQFYKEVFGGTLVLRSGEVLPPYGISIAARLIELWYGKPLPTRSV
ncbi:VOC family protein [Streptomyces sp. NPDC003857]